MSPWSIAAPASTRPTSSGTLTSFASGAFFSVAWLAPDCAHATRSPTTNMLAPGPTALTVPAPSLPSTKGVRVG